MTPLALLLTLTASLSPLLTFAHLWQIKEWRVDRLREHLRSEGPCHQLCGAVRPLLLLLLLPPLLLRWMPADLWTLTALTALALLTVLQIALDRQPCPLWTLKTLALVSGAFLLTLLAGLAVSLLFPQSPALALLPLLQPLALALSWLVFLPLDHFLKHRVMARAMSLRRAHPDLVVIGITGSVGKTTTKELLLHLLREQKAHATPAYVNTEMGVAQWLTKELSSPTPPKILIVEMGAYRRGEIALLCRITQPTIGIITFIGTQHMGLFGSQQALLETKAELFDALPQDGLAILNGDSPLADALGEHAHSPTLTVSTGGGGDLEAMEIEETGTGVRFRLGDDYCTLPLHGTHNVTNVLLALAAAEVLGLKRKESIKRLATFRPPEHTFSVRTIRALTLLDDTHNASPVSFKAAIGWAKAQPAEEKVLFTSGLIELGEAEDRIHTELGIEASGVFDRVIFTHRRHARAFERGLGTAVESFTKTTKSVSPSALLICVGRIPEELVRRLLPRS
ncbi:MAG: UDP-N-acetylmuramoyl-tripeptide--D-alanyl-D-alanine ligase [Candidatus Peribacteraceae bacterium]|nr:UDP-N-acetylmuramoyl-tripeptide--D-alanyl-D-alanine ligase [Candidatus Peribacteraceae bacterium]